MKARVEHFIGTGCKGKCCNSRDDNGYWVELSFKEKVEKNYQDQLRSKDTALSYNEPTFESDFKYRE